MTTNDSPPAVENAPPRGTGLPMRGTWPALHCADCRRWTREKSPDTIGACDAIGLFTIQTFGCQAWEPAS